ncbi:DUF1697 domain-containing protein [Luteolibacter soli]|uniref:DUF1697 domain-containing protein n=1 Tax=Luteolibacter soli TaxID=3135280 RepID=A0ABU9AWM6_9BACT
MDTYIALLRGINVSGKNPVPMAKLKETFAGLGFADVKTYLQSGNVVFRTKKKTAPAKLASEIEAAISHDFGHQVSVLVLTPGEIEHVAAHNPLWPKSGGELTHFHATFLFDPVSKATFDALKLPAAEGERALLSKGVVLLHCPHGYGNTKLNNTWFEKALKVRATTRNWRTVQALREMAAD